MCWSLKIECKLKNVWQLKIEWKLINRIIRSRIMAQSDKFQYFHKRSRSGYVRNCCFFSFQIEDFETSICNSFFFFLLLSFFFSRSKVKYLSQWIFSIWLLSTSFVKNKFISNHQENLENIIYRENFLKPGFHAVCHIGTMPQ